MPTSTSHELLERLIAFDSVSDRGTHAIAEFVAGQLREAADELHLLTCESHEQVNVLARIGPEITSRAGLLLSGHLDVVPAEEPGWIGEPFEPRVTHGDDQVRMFGRGSCDMKGAIACFLSVARAVDAASLRAPVWLLLSCNEEVGSLGVHHFALQDADRFNLPNQCIVGEPTSLRVVRMHKGHLKMRASWSGKTAHTGTPDLGINAINPAAHACRAIEDLQQRWKTIAAANGEFFSDAPYPIVNVVRMHGGSAWNVIPDQCVLDVGVRLLPGMHPDDASEEVRRACTVAFEGVSSVEIVNDNPPMLTADDAQIHQLCCKLVGQTTSLGVPFASDGGILKRDLDIDCVLFGPGSMAVAHQANEYVALSELDAYENLLSDAINSMCGAPTE